MVEEAVPRSKSEEWDPDALALRVREQFNVDINLKDAAPDHEKLQLDIYNVVEKRLKFKFDSYGDMYREFVQYSYLYAIDQLWKDHLLQMDHLRQGIHLRGYGQKDPKIEYKKEGFELFQIMKGRIASSIIATTMRIEPVQQPAVAQAATRAPAPGATSATLSGMPQRRAARTIETHGEAPTPRGDGSSAAPQGTVTRAGPRVGRNDPCPCGSGKKYKKCHLPADEGAPAPE